MIGTDTLRETRHAPRAVLTAEIPFWRDVAELYEPPLPEFIELRHRVLSHQRQEILRRVYSADPGPDAQEVALGVLREQLEIQCREAVPVIRDKGLATYSSGFGVGNLQVLDGLLSGIDAQTASFLTNQGYLVYGVGGNNLSIAFRPPRADLDEITMQWDRLAALLPNLGQPVVADPENLERFLGTFTEPGGYSYEMAALAAANAHSSSGHIAQSSR